MFNEEDKKNKSKEFDEKTKKEPLWYNAWFTDEHLDKRTYWLVILLMFLIWAIPNILKLLL